MEEKPEGGKSLTKSEERKDRLTDEQLVNLDTPDYLLEVSIWSGHLNITVATPVSLHCLQSGADIREKPVVAGIVWYNLNLWGKSDVTD